MIRFYLFLVSALNVSRDPSVNLATATCMSILELALAWFNVYENWYLNVLEASFIVNLLILSIGTYHVLETGGNQDAPTYTSVGIAFVMFCGVLVYHSCLQLSSTLFCRRKFLRFRAPPSSSDDTYINGEVIVSISMSRMTSFKCSRNQSTHTHSINCPPPFTDG